MRKRVLVILGSACLLAAPASAQSGQAAAAPTWNKDVAPIVFANCITCHRPGEVAPMSLMSYADARPWAKGMKAKVAAHQMPPWFADPRYGKFNNKRGLTEAQIGTIIAWADAGAPQGTGAAPVAPDYGDRSVEIMPRSPDAIIDTIQIPIPPNDVLPNFNITVKAPFTDTKYVEAVENRPSNRAVTHHSSFSAGPLPKGAHHIGMGPLWPGGPLANAVPVREDGSQLTDAADDTVGQEEEATANTTTQSTLGNGMTFYAPGTGQLRFKPGLVKIIRRDDYLRWGLHYNATGRPEVDMPSARFWFSKPGETVLEVKTGLVNENNLYEGQELIGNNVKRPNIPAYAENYRLSSVKAITSDMTLSSLWPHMHARGKDMTFTVTYPDGREEIILSVPRYSFEWQLQYQYENEIKLPAGSMLRVVAHFDNSPKNKYNPAPDQELPWGAQSWHEMFFPQFNLAVDKDVVKTEASQQGTN